MPVSESFKEYVIELVGDVRPIRSKRMFGGLGIWTADGDLFFALISDDVLYFKVNDETRPFFEERNSAQFMTMQYYEVPGDVIEDPELLREWVERAVDVAASAPRKAKRRR